MDILSEIISSSDLRGSILASHSFYQNWGFQFPCKKSFGFHVVTRGNCLIRYNAGTKKYRELKKGDIVFITKGFNHEIVSSIKQKSISIHELKQELENSQDNHTPNCSMISVRYEPSDFIHPFFSEIEDILFVSGEEIPPLHPIQSTLTLISNELKDSKSSELILQRLSDILLYYILKYWIEKHNPINPGWLRTLKDEKILYALNLLHKDISFDWTLESISNAIGISRATLAYKFKDALGITPLDYLSQIRIQKGRKLLKEENYSIEEVARKVGYGNSFSFSKAYKRIRGVSPSKDN